MVKKRPDPLRWLWYAYGGRLPERYREWVRRDVTGPRWRLRYAAQVLARTLPVLVAVFVVLTLVTDAPAVLVLAAAALALLFTLYFTLTSAGEFRNVRLVQHGYPPRTGRST